MHGLEADGRTARIIYILLASRVTFQTVTRIDVQHGFGGINRHLRLGGFISNHGSSLLVAAFCFQHEAVVVTTRNLQLGMSIINSCTNRCRLTEVKGRTLHLPHLAVQVFLGIESSNLVAVHPQRLVGNFLVQMSRDVEE